MYQKNIIALAFFSFCFGLIPVVHAQSTRTYNPTTTAVPFLRINPDARSGGMAGAGTAISPDANAVFLNGAKLPFIKSRSGIAATYTPWLRRINDEMFLATLAGYHKLNNDQTVSASIRYFNMGEAELADNNGNLLQTTRPREFAADMGYSRKLSEKTGVGIALRYINSNLGSGTANGSQQYKAASAIAADLSFFYDATNESEQGWRLGAALKNLGTKISYMENASQKDFIPANLAVGAAYTTAFNSDNKLTLAFDANKLLVPNAPQDSASLAKYYNHSVMESWMKSFDNSSFQFSTGAEYLYKDLFAVRAGFSTEIKNAINRKYFTTGAGINYSSFGLNFSYLIPFNDDQLGRNPLSNTLQFGLLYHFGK